MKDEPIFLDSNTADDASPVGVVCAGEFSVWKKSSWPDQTNKHKHVTRKNLCEIRTHVSGSG